MRKAWSDTVRPDTRRSPEPQGSNPDFIIEDIWGGRSPILVRWRLTRGGAPVERVGCPTCKSKRDVAHVWARTLARSDAASSGEVGPGKANASPFIQWMLGVGARQDPSQLRVAIRLGPEWGRSAAVAQFRWIGGWRSPSCHPCQNPSPPPGHLGGLKPKQR